MEYTKTKAIHRYNKYKAHSSYYLGFIYQHNIYLYIVDKLPRKNLFMKTECKKLKHQQSLSMYITNKDKREWIRKGAKMIGSDELLKGAKNKGIEFEKIIYKLNNQPFKKHSTKPFYKAGDIEINGIPIQIKFLNNLVRICYSNTLYRLEK